MLRIFVSVFSLLMCIRCDGADLQSFPELFILHDDGIWRYDMSGQNYTRFLEKKYTFQGVSMDAHIRHGMVFWSSITEGRYGVFSVNLKTKEINKLLSKYTEGLAVDWVHGNLYMSVERSDSIMVSRLNGSHIKVLVSGDIDKPRDVVVDPYYGWVYWSDWGNVPKIEKCGMNGRQRNAIVTTNIAWPNGLAIDYEQKRLYWVDAKMDYIASTDMEGQDRRTLLQGRRSVGHPFDIIVFEDYVYWTEWIGNSIHQMNKIAPGKNNEFATNLERPMSILVYDIKTQPVKLNHCGKDYGGCSHLCLPIPQKVSNTEIVRQFECACPDDMVLKNDYTCIDIAEKVASNLTQHTPMNDTEMSPQTSMTTITQPKVAEETLKLMNTTQTPTEISRFMKQNTTTKTEVNVVCGPPPPVKYANHDAPPYQDRFMTGTKLVFTCRPGYYRSYGSNMAFCSNEGVWVGKDDMTCEAIHCDRLRTPSFGYRKRSEFGTEFMAVVQFGCNHGYNLVGSEERTCQANRTWSGDETFCKEPSEVDCGHPGPLHNGYMDGRKTTVGGIFFFRCNLRTKIDGTSFSSLCMKNGSWSRPFPRCLGQCRIPEIIKGAVKQVETGKWVDHNTVIEPTCMNGLVLNDSRHVTCVNGSWNFVPVCVPAPSAMKTRLKEIWQGLRTKLMLITNSTNAVLTNEGKDEPTDCLEGDYNCRDATVRVYINKKTVCCLNQKQIAHTSSCGIYGEHKASCKCS